MSVRSESERVRRATFYLLGGGVLMPWLGAALSVLGRVQQGRPQEVLALGTLAGVVGLVVFTVLYVRIVLAAVAGRSAGRDVVLGAIVTLAVMALVPDGAWGWGLVGPIWASAAVLHLSRRWAWLTCAATVVACAVLARLEEDWVGGIAYYAMVCAVFPWANRFQLWLWQVVRAADEGREARARLAVSEERLRFARDLHDLVGHRLSAIAVKSEVAGKLAGSDGARAAAEMADVRRLARDSLREIRTAVRGYRTVDLHAELRSVRAVLEAGGVRCTLDPPAAELPEDLGTVLAWVVREGTTNVLRHSAATRCRIGVTVGAGRAVLTMCNDGADQPTGESAGERGSGLAGLAERVASLGGVLRAGPGGPGEFRLTATVPVGGRA